MVFFNNDDDDDNDNGMVTYLGRTFFQPRGLKTQKTTPVVRLIAVLFWRKPKYSSR